MSHLLINSSLHSPRQHSAPELGGRGGWRGQDDAGKGPGQLARVGQDHPGTDAEGEKQLLGWRWKAAGLREAELSQQGIPDRQGGARRGESLSTWIH